MADRQQNSFLAEPPKRLYLDQGFRFQSGQIIAPFEFAYETYGECNADKSNVILICHPLSKGPHAAGYRISNGGVQYGWWDDLIGFGKAIDLRKFFVICCNVPGSCFGTTSPATLDPRSGNPWGSLYPWPTIQDMIEAERLVMRSLGIRRLHTVVGGSFGGMRTLAWAASRSEEVESIVAMACGPSVPIEGLAWHLIARKAIEFDAAFHGGDYYGDPCMLRGLQIARMVGHMTYLSQQALMTKFGKGRCVAECQRDLSSYFEHMGQRFASHYDANSYLRILAAMDDMDLAEQYGSLAYAFKNWRGRTLLLSFDTDRLFPIPELELVERTMSGLHADVMHKHISTRNAHDAFLIDYDLISHPVREFLESPQCSGTIKRAKASW